MAENQTPEEMGAELKARLEGEMNDYETEVLMLEARIRDNPSSADQLQGRLDAARKNLERVKGALANPKMQEGGMAGGKRTPHMYVGGGAVVDNLPNPGLKALAKSPKGKQAVRKMGFDV
jgi:hypothetical protein